MLNFEYYVNAFAKHLIEPDCFTRHALWMATVSANLGLILNEETFSSDRKLAEIHNMYTAFRQVASQQQKEKAVAPTTAPKSINYCHHTTFGY